MSAIEAANYNGVYWEDIEWNKAVHDLPLGWCCPFCGIDGIEMLTLGHQSGCDFSLISRSDSPRLRSFVENEIKEALEREGRL